MSIKHVGNGVFVDTDPVDGYPNMYWYVDFRTLETVVVGIALTTGGPEDEEIDSDEVSTETLDPSAVAPLIDFNNAMEALRKGDKSVFEEYPFAEIKTSKDFQAFLDASEQPEEDFPGPGVYNLRDKPTYKAYDSVEEYEIENMEFWAGEVLESAFEGGEWEKVAAKLAKDNPEASAKTEKRMPRFLRNKG